MKVIKYIMVFISVLYIRGTIKAQTVEALGVPIKSSNLLWNLHPSNDAINNRVLPFFTVKNNGDVVSLLIDLKNITDNGISTERFSLITVNTTKDSVKTHEFGAIPGVSTPVGFGNPWMKFEGPDKKIYFCTAEGGGRLLQYDVESETAKDLGSPFVINNRTFGIYSLAIGSDSAIYGGSFSNAIGDTYVFRFDPKTNTYWKYLTPVDSELQYASYVGGDAENTYVICGQSTWNVYAINRATNIKRKLIFSQNRIYGIENTPCGAYITVDGVKYKLSANAATQQNWPQGCYPLNFTHTYTDTTLPKTYWNELTNTYYYQRKNEAEKSVVLNVPVQDKKIQTLVNYNDSLIVGNGTTYSFSISYNPTAATLPGVVGNNKLMSVYSMLAYNNKVYISGYPSGQLEEWDLHKPWTQGNQNLTYTPPPLSSPFSNPRLMANYRLDGAGIHQLLIVGATKSGHIIVTGNNFRTDTSISIGSYKNGVTQQLVNADRFAGYSVKGHTISASGNTAYILAQQLAGSKHFVFEYDPVLNNVIDSFMIFTSPVKSLTGLIMLPTEELFGEYTDAQGAKFVYTFDLAAKKISWQQPNLSSTGIFCKLGTDEQVWFSSTPVSPGITVFQKFNPYTKQVTTGPTLVNPDAANCTVTDIAFYKKDIYVGGYLNLVRIKDVVEPVPANLSPEQKIAHVFNSYKKIDMTCK